MIDVKNTTKPANKMFIFFLFEKKGN